VPQKKEKKTKGAEIVQRKNEIDERTERKVGFTGRTGGGHKGYENERTRKKKHKKLTQRKKMSLGKRRKDWWVAKGQFSEKKQTNQPGTPGENKSLKKETCQEKVRKV